MNSINVDARRYAWCRSQALWILGMPTKGYVEDLNGAEQAGQHGLLTYSARMIGDACAVALNLALNYQRPVPSFPLRSAWALEGLAEHDLQEPCWSLIRGFDDVSSEEIVARCGRLVRQVHELVGETPDILTPRGYYPAIAMARDWLKLIEAVGEQNFLSEEWTRPL